MKHSFAKKFLGLSKRNRTANGANKGNSCWPVWNARKRALCRTTIWYATRIRELPPTITGTGGGVNQVLLLEVRTSSFVEKRTVLGMSSVTNLFE